MGATKPTYIYTGTLGQFLRKTCFRLKRKLAKLTYFRSNCCGGCSKGGIQDRWDKGKAGPKMYGTVPAWPQGFGTEHMIGNRNLSSVEIGINHTLYSRCELFISGNVRK